ncbi:mevalonate kinase [Staphylococcus haemolyticus]|uniref:mevalonate kinase n=1 Tax=Staphylococcus haemolyticus TaxID=1283 RepID=UPI002901FC1F|nr:mevalonate kinase [Staphylococcus haemolyticus]MDU0423151.1 mevalonate kinase [Staphylococcus haemolyticus]MDU0439959.1 mevalonate kinase [Staphylococcus haemolyticus]MDU0442258.1 mevalonate kinase [Staphylococcus haemolyticus]MDU0445075.1 mevalonate kinase [Staphylococcus haemolyticus]MDU0449442.1 mevalonate kinase [Staphylococcus haemolyticus]
MVQRGYGESNGKIILIGEHAVTFGEPAIAIPFTSGKVKVLIESLEKGNYSAIQSDVYDGPLYDAPEHLKSLIGHFVENKKVEEPLLIKIQANLPPSRGLGSSAAVAVAFIRASYDYLGLPLTDKELLENADWAERIAHGKPSGIDTKTIVTNQPVWYQKGEVEILKTLDLDGYMVVIDTGVKGSTKQAVEDVHQLCDNDKNYMQVVKHIGYLVYSASEAIEHHSFDQLATIFNQCQDDLRTLTVSHDKIEMFLRLGEENGSVAGKLTGGGRGGSMLILAKELQTAKNIVAAVEKAGAQHTWIEKLGG